MGVKINVAEWLNHFSATGKLPSLRIPCTSDDCDVTTTCFGTNLEGRVLRTTGGLSTLLNEFKCRGCSNKAKGIVPKVKVVKQVQLKDKNLNKPPKEKKITKRSAKKTAKQNHVENLKNVVKSMDISNNAGPQKVNFKDPESVKDLTTNSCQRPDIYLDNERACDGCHIYELCACSARQLLADTGRKKVVLGPKRKK
jgi:hypothetical protein